MAPRYVNPDPQVIPAALLNWDKVEVIEGPSRDFKRMLAFARREVGGIIIHYPNPERYEVAIPLPGT